MANIKINQLQSSESELIELPDINSDKVIGGLCIFIGKKDDGNGNKSTTILIGKPCRKHKNK